jgi:hypothetical protein
MPTFFLPFYTYFPKCWHRLNKPTKHSKYVVNQKLEHVDDISFRAQGICIYVGHSFL